MAMLSEGENRLERIRRTSGFFLAPLIFLVLYFIPIPSLSPEAHRLLAIVVFTVICWVTECIPLPIAAILGPTLAVILRVDEAKSVYAPFADPIVILLLGSFIIAKAMTAQRLDRRFAFGILSIKGISHNSNSVMLGLGLVVFLLSMWVSNSATTAMMLPIGLGILSALKSIAAEAEGFRDQRYETGLMLIIAYSASIGGISTPVGTPPNLITLGMLEKLGGIKIDFLRWMAVAVPISLFMFLFFWLYMSLASPSPSIKLKGFSRFISEEKKKLGKWRQGEINVLIAFGIAVVLWVAPGFISIFLGTDSAVYKTYNKALPESVVAIIAACTLFILPTNWKAREFTLSLRGALDIDWGTLLLFGGGLSLGAMMFKTGLAEAIGKYLINLTGANSLISITALGIFLAITLSEATSNTATANMLLPLIIAIAASAGISPLPPAIAVGIGASFGFMLPVSTPPNAIVYGSGLIPITKMIKYGFIVDIVGYVIVFAGILILCPLVGLG
ncbi:MAG TPA: DASS family sodium-coupled anion symporter [Thermodesulfobacteriota bacterium]|nr:DASS family sodium-coupled anion symporter [Thermodesulfobacteriota bacterium]